MILLAVFLLLPAVSAWNFDIPCDVETLPGFAVPSEIPYRIRNSSSNAAFNRMFKPQKLMEEIGHKDVHTFDPLFHMLNKRVENFNKSFYNHFIKYENMTMQSILEQEPLDIRNIWGRINETNYILSNEMLSLHECDKFYKADIMTPEFFIGAKGQSTAIHRVNYDALTQITSGKKLWFFFYDQEILRNASAIMPFPHETVSLYLDVLLNNPSVKKCITSENDIMYIPKDMLHAEFNIENSLSHSCAQVKSGRGSQLPEKEKCEENFGKDNKDIPEFMKLKAPDIFPIQEPKVLKEPEPHDAFIQLDFNGEFNKEIPCTIPEVEYPVNYNKPYIIRNSSFNSDFNAHHSIRNLQKYLKNTTVMSVAPWQKPTRYLKTTFDKVLETLIFPYENMSLYEAVHKRRNSNSRAPWMRFNLTHSLIPPDVHARHTCTPFYNATIKNFTQWDYFMGGKANSVMCHQHNSIFTQVTSGKKLWLFPESPEVLNEMGLTPTMTPTDMIEELVNNPKVKQCVAFPNDITFIPYTTFHCVFNIETTLAHGCIVFDNEEQYKHQVFFNSHINLHDLQ